MIKEYLQNLVYGKYPAVEYAAGAVESYEDTKKIIAWCPFSFSSKEALVLFLRRLTPNFFGIFLFGIFFGKYIEPLAVALHEVCNLPQWTLSICIFYAMVKVTDVFSELFCEMS